MGSNINRLEMQTQNLNERVMKLERVVNALMVLSHRHLEEKKAESAPTSEEK